MRFNKDMLLLYAVTDRRWTGSQTLYQQVEAALKGGATLIQLREKDMDEEEFLKEAREIADLCHSYKRALIINDNVKVALKSGADGVHVGQEDMSASDIRKTVPEDFVIGAVSYTHLDSDERLFQRLMQRLRQSRNKDIRLRQNLRLLFVQP